MTVALMSWLMKVRVSLVTRLVLVSLALCLLPFTLTVDMVRLLRGVIREKQLLSAGSVLCPAGHEVELHGGWRCGCSITYEGSGFGACPGCGERSWVMCPCGRSVRNPLGGRRL